MLSSSAGEIITCEVTSCWHDDESSHAVLNLPKLTQIFAWLLLSATAHPTSSDG